MFCDLVGSTPLSGQLDPEELREVVQEYQTICEAFIRRFGGYVARYMGDGLLVYFGYPQAHEDDAERALRTGLEIIERAGQLKPRDNLALQTRVGVATGLVVVGETIGEASSREQVVMGETPNLAARLQGLAEPDHMVIADSTRRLCGDVFDYDNLGEQSLKGFDDSISAYAVVGERSMESRFAAHSGQHLLPIIGREQEIGLLAERWRLAKEGEGQLVLLTGEAGIGKSRITRAMIDAVAEDSHYRINYQCSPYHTNSAFYPIIQRLERAADFAAADDTETRLDKLEALLRRSSNDIDSDEVHVRRAARLEKVNDLLCRRCKVWETQAVLLDPACCTGSARTLEEFWEEQGGQCHSPNPLSRLAEERAACNEAFVLVKVMHR